VATAFDGRTSAGQVTEPFPSGDILGSNNGSYNFYVVDSTSGTLTVDLPKSSRVEPGKGAIDIDVLQTDDLSNVNLHYTTVMPGFILEESMSGNLSYTYDAPLLNQTFPNIDLEDDDSRTGVDTITMSFLVSGEDGGGNTVYRARQVLLQGEELLAMPQQPPASNFKINAGHAGAWFNPETPGQGQLIDIEPVTQFMFLAWFTFTDAASDNPFEQHWFTAQGNYSGDTADLLVYESLGGKFDDPQEVSADPVGKATLSFSDCGTGQLDYTIDTWDLQGSFPLQRAIPGTENVCEERTGLATEPLEPNDGRDGAWFEEATPGQGFLIDAQPGDDFVFVSWFTYGDDTASGQRWLTAQGPLEGATADIIVYETVGGSFDDPDPSETNAVGTMTIDFTDCSNALLSYSITDEALAGIIDIQRAIPGTEALCEELTQ
jgi:hypothetical protein